MMITPGMLNAMFTMEPIDLTLLLEQSGYLDCEIRSTEFKGITPCGSFAYHVTFDDDDGDGVATVFVSYDHDRDVYVAEW